MEVRIVISDKSVATVTASSGPADAAGVQPDAATAAQAAQSGAINAGAAPSALAHAAAPAATATTADGTGTGSGEAPTVTDHSAGAAPAA